ncbi:hypothetical protein GCM10022226_02710 [Sphaerisporangium flaviroseum]|uniref:Uncharacterized protein n=1 Tax=Sphaerisporangium flaviroseum TaxID=509199 RepID=A0ABP7HBN0_9ACTN
MVSQWLTNGTAATPMITKASGQVHHRRPVTGSSPVLTTWQATAYPPRPPLHPIPPPPPRTARAGSSGHGPQSKPATTSVKAKAPTIVAADAASAAMTLSRLP